MKLIIDSLFEDIKRFSDQGIHPSAVIFSGDLISAGDHGYSKDRNEYEAVCALFIEPLLDLLGLQEDRLFICAGNHDVQRSLVDKYLEAGLKSQLVDRDSVNSLIDEFESNPEIFRRMQNFERFRTTLSNIHAIQSSVLFSTFTFTHEEHSIGIACINTAWRAFGGNQDYGQLIVGERVIDQCIADLKHCSLRIGAVHHPFEYLQEFERDGIRRRIFGGFHIWLTGHSHTPDVSQIQQFNNERIITIGGGALYYSRDYFNGFSLIEYSFDENSVKVYLREYLDRDRSFHPAIAYKENNGTINFTVAESSVAPLDIDLSILEKLREHAELEANSILLPAVVKNSIAPKSAREVFVEPPLARKSEYKGIADEDGISLADICQSDKNYLLVGEKEIGKTTVLNHIRLFHLDPERIDVAKTPFFIDFMDLPKEKNRIIQAISNALEAYDIKQDTLEVLRTEKCLILIDNFDFKDQKSLSAFQDFIAQFPDHQYILTMNQKIFDELLSEDPLLPGLSYEKVYIHRFGRKQIRELAEKWYSESVIKIQPGEVADEIQQRLDEIGLPFTPYIISMMFLIIEQQSEYHPNNKASLVGDFIRLLLEQPFGEEIAPGGIDYRNIEDLLSHIAIAFYKHLTSCLSSDEFIKISISYFEDRGLPVPGGVPALISLLISRGILVEAGGVVEFRFISFLEFFIAKAMQENKVFYEDVISESNYLSFSNSIDFLTGLERKNYELIKILRKRVESALGNIISSLGLENIDVHKFDTLRIDHSIIEEISDNEREAFIASIRKSRVSEGVKDAISDVVYRRAIRIPEPSPISEDPIEHLSVIFPMIRIYANCIRNCELIDDMDFKRSNLRFCIESALVLLYLLYMTLEGIIQEFDQSDLDDILAKLKSEWDYEIEVSDQQVAEMVSLVQWAMKLFPALMFEAILSEWLGSPKLRIVIEEEIQDKSLASVIRLINVLIYTDLRLSRFQEHLDVITQELIDNRFYREILYMRLRYIYSMRGISPKQRQALENIIAGIVIKDQDKPPREKSKIIGKLRSRPQIS